MLNDTYSALDIACLADSYEQTLKKIQEERDAYRKVLLEIVQKYPAGNRESEVELAASVLRDYPHD
jgi:hypothetical protein